MCRALLRLGLLALACTFVAASAAANDIDVCNRGDGDDRLAACTRLLASRKLNVRNKSIVFNIRGNLWSDKGETDRAINDYDEAIRLDVKNEHAFANRGHRWVEKGQNDRAIEDYDRAIRLNPRSASAYNGKGNALANKGDTDAAIAAYELSIRLAPNDPVAYVSRGSTFFDKGEYRRALADFDEALRVDPMATAAYVRRGLAYEQLGDDVGARNAYNAALTVPPKYTNGRWAHEKARERLAALKSKIASQRQPITSTPPVPAAAAKPVIANGPSRRVALLIGNATYSNISPLTNPRKDADALAATLRSVGFQTVTLENDLPREKLINALRMFGRLAEQADWAIIYYAGHGLEVGGTNYLLPVDAALESDRDVQFAAVPLDYALASVEGARSLRLVILDACRDNPFVQRMKRSGMSRSVGRGLSRVEPEGGTVVAYAAKHGEIALDGDGAHSPFVSALIKHIPTPGVEISKLFRLVRDEVMTATGRRQEPFVYGSLPADDYFFVAAK